MVRTTWDTEALDVAEETLELTELSTLLRRLEMDDWREEASDRMEEAMEDAMPLAVPVKEVTSPEMELATEEASDAREEATEPGAPVAVLSAPPTAEVAVLIAPPTSEVMVSKRFWDWEVMLDEVRIEKQKDTYSDG